MPDEIEWITLYNPTTMGYHRVPNTPDVVQDFQDRGFETPEDSAARAEADTSLLRGKDLEDALEEAGLSKSGTVKDKQARLAEYRRELAPPPPEPHDPFDPIVDQDTTTEGEQV
jgi:hypothetical protein